MKSIAIIPARGGSVRVPRKNVKLLNGVPLIAYTIRQAIESKAFDKIIVSTEDDEIRTISETEGAEVILRPKPLAEDVETELVLKHVVEFLDTYLEYYPDIVTLLQCTSPLRRSETIDNCIYMLINNFQTMDSVITVSNIEGIRPEWMGTLRGDKFTPYTNFWTKNGKRFIKLVARQDLPTLYRQNGCVYSFKTDLLMKEGILIGTNCGAIPIDEIEAHDIDTDLDFRIAEELLKEYR